MEEDLLDKESGNTLNDDFASKVAALAGILEAALKTSRRMSKRQAMTLGDDSLDCATSLKAARNLVGKECNTIDISFLNYSDNVISSNFTAIGIQLGNSNT
ncbi:unnamed protein product, partial [Urochloa humidicola]